LHFKRLRLRQVSFLPILLRFGLTRGGIALASEISSPTPASAGATKIGHFGSFRPEHRNCLWKDAADWLLAG
jgi:hypothetical protein